MSDDPDPSDRRAAPDNSRSTGPKAERFIEQLARRDLRHHLPARTIKIFDTNKRIEGLQGSSRMIANFCKDVYL